MQAQDRLFQLDLWRRSTQGRLAEVLGSNFIGRDVMTRRIQRGALDPRRDDEWASYAPDAKAIAQAFVRGVNAEVAIARRDLPEEFVLAGWAPDLWTPEDLLSRTDAFTASDNALSEVFRARIVSEAGAAQAAVLLPLDPPGPETIPHGLDTRDIRLLLGDAIRRVGTAPFFMGLAAEPDPSREARAAPRTGSNAWVIAPTRSDTGAAIVASDPHRALANPSLFYLVHLSAPGWDVEGATFPWLPGVVIGHNERVAWGMSRMPADVQDIYVERVNPANAHEVQERGRWVPTTVVHDAIRVKGRAEPFAFDHEYTRHGPIVAVDRQKNLAFALRWSGGEPAAAAYLASLALDRTRSSDEFRAALARWKMPAENVVFADTAGRIGHQVAALVPIRRGWNGMLPVPGWSGEYEWSGWRSLDDLPHGFDPADGYVATANDRPAAPANRAPIALEWPSPARIDRIREVLTASPVEDLAASRRLQKDVTAWNAEQLVPLLDAVHADRADVEAARERLRAWDRQLTADSLAAALYVLWERALAHELVAPLLDRLLGLEYLSRVDYTLVPALTSPTAAWFGSDPIAARDALLVRALSQAVDGMQQRTTPGSNLWGRLHTATFRHPLGITAETRARLNAGPFQRPGYADTVNATYGPGFEQTGGASFREILDLADWDRSIATNAPGQSGSPTSPHFADLTPLWVRGEYFPLAFSDAAVRKSAETTLLLRPAR